MAATKALKPELVPGIRPQPGPQEAFLASSSDIVVFGGAAGGGKTYALLIEPLRHIRKPQFGAVIFRRLSTNITGEGGLWDTSRSLYPLMRAQSGLHPRMHWKFPSGAKVSFAHLQYEQDVMSWQGAQIPALFFDELTHFTAYQFWYMLSRNRSISGVRPYIRATCNPDADSWVAKLVEWWIDPDTGYPIHERAGVLRYFTRLGEEMVWGDTPQEVVDRAGRDLQGDVAHQVKSITFIPSTLADNAILMKLDPAYRANLLALPRVERERLLGGNWKVRATGGTYFPISAVETIPAVPADVVAWCRSWDLAASPVSENNSSPDATCGVLMGKRADGRYVIADVQHMRAGAAAVRLAVRNMALQDRARFGRVVTVVPQDPAQAGKEQAQSYAAMLAGHTVAIRRETGDKQTRAEPLAAQWQVGNVAIVEAPWNSGFLSEMDAFPDADHDDCVDAASGAFTQLTNVGSALERARALVR
jgi:predicted phage terminase large subunit-like protein